MKLDLGSGPTTVPPQLVDAALPLLRAAGPAGDVVGEAVAMHGLVGSTQGARRSQAFEKSQEGSTIKNHRDFPLKTGWIYWIYCNQQIRNGI